MPPSGSPAVGAVPSTGLTLNEPAYRPVTIFKRKVSPDGPT